MNKKLFLSIILLGILVTLKSQQWVAVTLPPGVSQIGGGGSSFFNTGANFCYVTTNYGAGFYKLNVDVWEPVSFPPGATAMNNSGCNFIGAGNNYIWATTGSGTNIYRYDGTAWASVPMPPMPVGVTKIGDGATSLPGASGDYLYFTKQVNSQDELYRYDGTSWTLVPLPPVTGNFYYSSTIIGASGNYLYSINDYGAYFYRYNGSVWESKPLPPGVSQLQKSFSYFIKPKASILSSNNTGTGPGTFYGAGGEFAYASASVDDKFYSFDGTTWSEIPLPPGSTQMGGTATFRGTDQNSPYATTNYGANLYKYVGITTKINGDVSYGSSFYLNENKLHILRSQSVSNPFRFTIYNLQGNIILSGTIQNTEMSIDIKHFTKGVYILVVSGSENEQFKFII